ncbi:MAG TPA: DUF2726 domain-containing protein [Novosphingobium sp.]|nr:DUF2726 domain-containing protein [Novosphingobium sp.]HMP55710.1 DUF2726 domain-containing protein [Novosphingobium sp.]
MDDAIAMLLDHPLVLLLVLAIGAAIGIGVERFVEGQQRAVRKAFWRGRNASPNARQPLPVVKPGPNSVDAADQLRTVMSADFSSRPLLNRSERRVFAHLEVQVEQVAADWKVMCQVSLGEILASPSKDAFLAVNAKRVDFLIVDGQANPLLAIEYQGSGHYQASAAARDAVKREALRRAGIGFAEIGTGDKPSDLRAIIAKLASGQSAAARAG